MAGAGQSGLSDPNAGHGGFQNLQSLACWSGTQFAPRPCFAWNFGASVGMHWEAPDEDISIGQPGLLDHKDSRLPQWVGHMLTPDTREDYVAGMKQRAVFLAVLPRFMALGLQTGVRRGRSHPPMRRTRPR